MSDLSEGTASYAEKVFVGCLINGDTRATDSGLREADFTDGLCRRIFAIALALEARGQVCDLVTLTDTAPDIDASAAVDLTTQAIGRGALAGQYAMNIRAAAERKIVAAVGLTLAQEACDPDKPLSEILNGARTRLDAMESHLPSGGTIDGTDALCGFYERLTSGTVEPVVQFGFRKPDNALLIAGNKLIVIGARPSVGKSALLSHLMLNALDAGRRVLLVSMEMSSDELIARMVARKSGVPVEKVCAHRLTDKEIWRVAESFQLLPGECFSICTTARTVQDVRREALRMRAKGGLDLVIVDYLQLLDAGTRTNNRAEAVGIVTKALKGLAGELNIPVVTASQLNRASERNDAPRLSDLRESGNIEQDADAVLLLHAPNEKSAPERELTVAKNRNGRCGGCNLLFDGTTMLFTEAV